MAPREAEAATENKFLEKRKQSVATARSENPHKNVGTSWLMLAVLCALAGSVACMLAAALPKRLQRTVSRKLEEEPFLTDASLGKEAGTNVEEEVSLVEGAPLLAGASEVDREATLAWGEGDAVESKCERIHDPTSFVPISGPPEGLEEHRDADEKDEKQDGLSDKVNDAALGSSRELWNEPQISAPDSSAAAMPQNKEKQVGLPEVRRAPPVDEVPKGRACCAPCRGK